MLHASRRVLLLVGLLSAIAAPAFAQPLSSSLDTTFGIIFYYLLGFPVLAYWVAYMTLYKRIVGDLDPQFVYPLLEAIAVMVIAVVFYAFLENTLLNVGIVFLSSTLYFLIRLHYRLQPAYAQRAANDLKRAADELQRKQETLDALSPLLNHLHGTYGRYSGLPDCVPAAWYAPHKHYIEYMAAFLYTFHAEQKTAALIQHGITADTPPLVKLRWLSFPRYPLQQAQFEDPRHPLNVLTRAITDPNDQYHSIFRDLIPPHVDLLDYLKTERWKQPLEQHAEELNTLVTREIIKQKYVSIGTPTNRSEYPLPILYREERFNHTYVIGKTGSGKSTLLRNLIIQDIQYGNGVIVLSPENDLFEKLLLYIPERRIDDLLYFDPTDITLPIIGFNPFTLEKGENLNQKAGETMTALKRALGDLGVTMEPLIDNAVRALLQRPHSTFADLSRLIDPYDPTLRATIKNDPDIDETTRLFWQRYERSSYYQKSHEAVLNRLNPFFRPPISTILATPSFSFKTELNTDRRIIFLNLSRLRDKEAATIGQLLLAQIQQALLVRDELPENQRIPHYLYIDEFQTYAGDAEQSLINVLNGARKYKLGITLAHQTTADIPSKLLDVTVGNVGTIVCLKLAAGDAPFFAKQLQIKKEGRDVFDPEALQNLNPGYGYVQTPTYNVGVKIAIPVVPSIMGIFSIPLPFSTPSDELKARSKQNFGLTPAPKAPRQPAAETTPPEEPKTAQTEPAPRQARKPVVRTPKPSVLPDEDIEIQ